MTDMIQNAVKWDHPAAAHATIIDADKGIIDWKGRTKFGLVGFASSSRDLAPWDDPEWILMGLNQLYRHCPRFDAWIDIHHYFRDPRSMVDGTDEIEWMKHAPIPIFQHERQPDIPNSVRYPIEDVSGQNPAYPWGVDYFTSTISYMIALAIRDGFKTIGVWGVDLIVGQEYCVDPKTRVLTSDLRWVNASTLKVGDRLLAFDEEPVAPRSARFYKDATVESVAAIKRPCYHIRLDDGTYLVSSAEHRWLTKVGNGYYRWRQTDELVTRYHRHPSRLVRLTDVWDEDRSWQAGYLAAAFDGEGNLLNQQRSGRFGMATHLQYAQRPNGMSTEVEAGLAELGFKWSHLHGKKCDLWNLLGGRPEILRFLGQVRPRRLLDKFSPEFLGRVHSKAAVPVKNTEFLGEQDVITLKTSAATFIAEGFASHNSYQKACAEMWLGIANGQGIEIHLPAQTALLKHGFRYGYQTEPDLGPLKLSMFDAREKEIRGRLEAVTREAHTLDGALQDLSYWRELYTLRSRGGVIGEAT